MKRLGLFLLLTLLLSPAAFAATGTLSTHGVTGTINYRLVWNRRDQQVRAYWGGGPAAEYATTTISAEDHGAAGVFALRAGAWQSSPLDARIDPATPATGGEQVNIRDAVLDVLEADVAAGSPAVVNARKNGRKQHADDLRILELTAAAARAAAIQAKIDELVVEE